MVAKNLFKISGSCQLARSSVCYMVRCSDRIRCLLLSLHLSRRLGLLASTWSICRSSRVGIDFPVWSLKWVPGYSLLQLLVVHLIEITEVNGCVCIDLLSWRISYIYGKTMELRIENTKMQMLELSIRLRSLLSFRYMERKSCPNCLGSH